MKTTFTLEAGRYIVTDPCYVIHKERYQDFLKVLDARFDDGRVADRSTMVGRVEFEGKPLVLFNTYGDGGYEALGPDTTIDFMIGVDTAIIGVIPFELAEIGEDFYLKDDRFMIGDDREMGAVVEFTEAFDCAFDDDVICVGNEHRAFTIEIA